MKDQIYEDNHMIAGKTMGSNETKISERRKYQIDLSAADDVLKIRCSNITVAVYGDPIPKTIMNRMTAEFGAIRENKLATHYLNASELAKYSVEKGYSVSTRGLLPSSLVSFLSGISNVNPRLVY